MEYQIVKKTHTYRELRQTAKYAFIVGFLVGSLAAAFGLLIYYSI